MKTSILMSYENPTGYKLEELADALIKDMEIKTAKIDPNEGEVDQLVLNNNVLIIGALENIRDLQNESIAAMQQIGEDRGPYVKEPRIGDAPEDVEDKPYISERVSEPAELTDVPYALDGADQLTPEN